MIRRHLRLAAGTLALALPLAGAAACGAEKKRTIKQEFAAAQSNLESSKAASFTLHLDDSRGSIAGLVAKDGETPKALAEALLKGSITYTADPAGDAALRLGSQCDAVSFDMAGQLDKANAAFVIRDDKTVVAELRVVSGDLYAKVDLTEVSRLAGLAGVKDFDAQLDEAVEGMGAEFGQVITDARAGKFLKLQLKKYLSQLQDLAGAVAPTPSATSGEDAKRLCEGLYAAIKPHVTITDANDDSDNRVLDVKVKVKPALKAAIDVLKAETSLPFLSALGKGDMAELDEMLSDGEAKGTITLKSGHLSQIAVDLESLRLLASDPGTDSLAGARLVFDVDDSAEEVAVPSNVSSFDVGALLDEFMQAFTRPATASLSVSGSYTG